MKKLAIILIVVSSIILLTLLILLIMSITKSDTISNKHFTIGERVEYYLGSSVLKTKFCYSDTMYKLENEYGFDKLYWTNYLELKSSKRLRDTNYVFPILEVLKSFPKELRNVYFGISFGDSLKATSGCISKIRGKDHKNVILSKLNPRRHWDMLNDIKTLDIPFGEKINEVIFRGEDTGHRKGCRLNLMKTYFSGYPQINVGFSKRSKRDVANLFQKSAMTPKEILKYKYIISVEGNDVASGLKWQLLSNSVVFMRKPTLFSWAMEDKLKPYLHYIPLKYDFSDLVEQMDWANRNQEWTQKISMNSTEYMQQFLDLNRENEIQSLVMKEVLKMNQFCGN